MLLSVIFIFLLAGIAEIGGGYLIWLWLREGKPAYLGLIGGITLAIYGVIATFQLFPSFGRVYAAGSVKSSMKKQIFVQANAKRSFLTAT
ncbi:YnfA family protein, partial [Bacillus sp. 03113]|uniref:YnfA family protein n=1 Tax=Bacillus sp. 03113 TaxID=2578211 RepID=UPI0037BEE02E